MEKTDDLDINKVYQDFMALIQNINETPDKEWTMELIMARLDNINDYWFLFQNHYNLNGGFLTNSTHLAIKQTFIDIRKQVYDRVPLTLTKKKKTKRQLGKN